MRIALISKWLARESERFGPAGGFVQQTAEALLDRGHEVIALSQVKGARADDTRPIGRIPTHRFDAERRRPWLALADKLGKSLTGHRKIVTDALEIRRFLRDQGPFDCVWAQAEDPDGSACGVAARLGAIPPLLITVQAVRWQETGEGRLRFTHQRNLRLGFSRAAVVAANSPLCAQWLRDAYGVTEKQIGYYRVNLTRSFLAAAQLARDTRTDASSSQRLLFLGALNATKAPDIFLAAARQLAARAPVWHFVIAGGETEKNPALDATLAALRDAPELRGRVTFTGGLDEARVIDEITRARLVVCPSRIDTLSRATVEALALGRPVVVAENVGARHLVESTGAGVVTACEASAVAAGMERVLNEPGYTQRAHAQAATVASEHSPEQAALAIESLAEKSLTSCAASPGRPGRTSDSTP